MDGTEVRADSRLLTQLPQRLHHHAYVVRDQEINRKFFEDVLGLPLVATWCERAYNGTVKREVEYCHTFYGLGDGGALAFFQFADADVYESAKAVFPQNAAFWHIALKVDRATLDDIARRLDDAKIARRTIDHGYCASLYTESPDGLRVEFTVDPPDVDRINAMRLADAHQELTRWLAGDHHINNTDRH
jgi:catechol 2,3-dioxygenase-like lactoylglutathione lyase family enzyme